MKKSAVILAAAATLGICATLSNGAQHRINQFVKEKEYSFASFAKDLGFTISSHFNPVHVSDDVEPNGWHFKKHEYKEKNKLNHYSEVYDALLQSSIDNDCYLYCYRVTMDPYQVRDYGFFGIGSSGDDWALRSLVTTVEFQKTISFGPQNTPEYQIINFAPQNQSGQWGSTMGFSFGVGNSGATASVSATVNYNHSELTVSSGTKVGQPFYKTNYFFRAMNEQAYTSYLLNVVYCYGMVLFRYHYNVKLTIKHDIQYFGRRWYDTAGPGKVHFGYNLVY